MNIVQGINMQIVKKYSTLREPNNNLLDIKMVLVFEYNPQIHIFTAKQIAIFRLSQGLITFYNLRPDTL